MVFEVPLWNPNKEIKIKHPLEFCEFVSSKNRFMIVLCEIVWNLTIIVIFTSNLYSLNIHNHIKMYKGVSMLI